MQKFVAIYFICLIAGVGYYFITSDDKISYGNEIIKTLVYVFERFL